MANRDPRPVNGTRVRVPTVPVAAAAGQAQAGVAASAQQTAEVFGREMSRLSAQLGQAANAAAEREGAQAGALAGMAPGFQTQNDGTIYGEAFDASGISSARNRMLVQVDSQIEALAQEHQRDPSGLRDALQRSEAGFKRGVARDPRLAAAIMPQIEAQFARKGLGAVRQVSQAVLREERASQFAALQEANVVRMRSLEQDGYRLGLDPAADDAIAGQLAEFDASLSAAGPDGQPLVSPADRQKLLRGATESVTRARIEGAFDAIETLDGQAAFLDTLESQFRSGEGAGGAFGLTDYQRIDSRLRARMAKTAREAQAQRRALHDAIKSVTQRAEKGFAAPETEMAALRQAAASANDAEAVAALDAAEQTVVWQERIRQTPPALLEDFVRQEREAIAKSGGSEGQVARLATTEKILATSRVELKRDPLGWAARTGVADIAPLDFTPENVAASVADRLADADTVARHFGQAPRYLRPGEKRALAATLEGGGDAALGVMATLADTAGPRAVDVLAELGDEAPTMAMLGGLALQSVPQDVVRDAADGVALRQQDGFRRRAPSRVDGIQPRADVIGNAFAALPRTEAPVLDLADAIYETRARRNGIEDFDGDLYKDALHAAVGGHVRDGIAFGGFAEINDQRVVVPAAMPRGQFEEALAAITSDDVPPAFHSDGSAWDLKQLSSAHLLPAGNNRYAVFMDDPADPDARFPVDAEGQPYVLALDDALTGELVERVGLGGWMSFLSDVADGADAIMAPQKLLRGEPEID